MTILEECQHVLATLAELDYEPSPLVDDPVPYLVLQAVGKYLYHDGTSDRYFSRLLSRITPAQAEFWALEALESAERGCCEEMREEHALMHEYLLAGLVAWHSYVVDEDDLPAWLMAVADAAPPLPAEEAC